MKAAIIEFWERLDPQRRKQAVMGGVVGVVILLALLGYYGTGQDEKRTPQAKEPEKKPILLGDQLAEDDIRKQLESDRSKQNDQNRVMTEQITGLKEGIEKINKTLTDFSKNPRQGAARGTQKNEPIEEVESALSYPPPISDASPITRSAPSTANLEASEPVFVGAIAHAAGAAIAKKDDGKKKQTVYLAPGFMDGMLLTGLRAETIAEANENPEPMLIRIQAPAVLPNSIKADLKGCFVVANGYGKLNKERVEGRLVSLHCINYKEQAVIDEKIHGFIADEDGTKGINGRVVTKAGANVVRVFTAGVFGGIGESIRADSTSVSVSPLGNVESTVDGKAALKKGLGTGVADAAADIRKVFLDLVKQSTPVIEVGPTKKLAVVLTEGISLEIRDLNNIETKK